MVGSGSWVESLKHQADIADVTDSRANGGGASSIRDRAIAAYTDAFETLQSIRKDLLATNPEIQFSLPRRG